MPSPQVDAFAKMLRKSLPGSASIEMAAATVKQDLEAAVGVFSPEMESSLGEAVQIVRKEYDSIEILKIHSIMAKRPDWYHGPKPGDRHWPALKSYITDTLHWSEDTASSIDASSNEVVSLLADPGQTEFSCRGLVVGYVQSGKTANMTAVIAKAIDAGYDTILILAGMTDKLRQQTQSRLEKDLVNRIPVAWQRLTSSDIHGDFQQPMHGGLLSHQDKAQIAVVKKNVGPLKKLLQTIESTLPITLRKLRVLVIDDECDQASVNSASGELDITKINELIRSILARLPRVSYVGYTATPFANVLIRPFPNDGSDLDDLYPKDFITALPLPKDYFGPEKLFGRPPVDAENPDDEDEGLDMIRTVPEADAQMLQPARAKDRGGFQPQLPLSMKKAILYFIACCAARRARGDDDKHMSMLVHTSAFVILHERVATLIKGWLEVISAELANRSGPCSRLLEEVWQEERGRLPAGVSGARQISVDEVFVNIAPVLDNLEVPVENGSSDDRIDYSGPPKTYVVVGGTVLARGLTLEGLMVSYFLRTANQYDTLLQMGRWFGYRPNYEDLPRIWMPDSLHVQFRALAGIEAEIREDIDEYVRRKVTPMEFAVRIRSIPGMAITAAAKMKSATKCGISYSGEHVQTIRFDRCDANLITTNWQAGSDLVSQAAQLGKIDQGANGQRLFRDVPKAAVVQFFRKYSVHPQHRELATSLLLGFLETSNASLSNWDIGVVEPREGKLSSALLGTVGHVRMSNRSRLRNPPDDLADIKALMSRSDVLFDCSPVPRHDRNSSWDELKKLRTGVVGQVPLLLLYPVDGNSTARAASKSRVDLDAVGDLLGFGIVFPGDGAAAGAYYRADLQPLSVEEVEEIEDEELAQAEAAGVN